MEKYELKGKRMKCPKCGRDDNLSRNESVLCNTRINVHPNGRWDWSGSSDVHWETSDYRPDHQDEAEWRCHWCDIDFNAPHIVNGDKDDPAVEDCLTGKPEEEHETIRSGQG